MEPINILIYLSIFFLVITGPLAILVLFRLARILGRLDRVTEYVDHVRGLLEQWEQLPLKLLEGVFGKFFDK